MSEFTVVHYMAPDGGTPFEKWYRILERIERAKVIVALGRLAAGNFSNVKPVGAGVLEARIHYGPGYRIYFGRDGSQVIVLLGGGTEQRQQRDIEDAQHAWRDYWKRRSTVRPLED